jgi:hypothetical protein
VYSTLLVKLVFLVSLNSGVYLPATYQALLLCFAVLIQLVIGKIVLLVLLKIRVCPNGNRTMCPWPMCP